MSTNQTDWVSQSQHFARIPLEILSANLTLNELELFIALASFAQRNGNLGHFTKCQKTLGEVLGWINKGTGEGNNKRVSDTLATLKTKGLVTTKKRPGNNRGIDYQLHLPSELELRPTLDRSTPEYLALAEAKRQAVLKIYKAKTIKEIDRRLAGFEFKEGDIISDFEEPPEFEDDLSSEEFQEASGWAAITHGFEDITVDIYDEEVSPITADYSALLADSIIEMNLSNIPDKEFKQRFLNFISEKYPNFIHLDPNQKNDIFLKVFRFLNKNT